MELVIMTKITNTWFQCALCPVEGDTYYLLTRDGKEIKVCEICYKRLTEVKNNGREIHTDNYTDNQR
ncbi:hypothetical protein LCGC14_2341520 [marine sediment metagenome]|uniref:Uncharacterized protein n=1 Tax=marine sediment metagenome TaxID=412755 RepID=A0A0F9CBU2_9ZZZZ